jgi:dTDP-4-dehydrorhamnose reductase
VKVVVAGASGQVGRALVASAPSWVKLCAATRDQLDITDQTAVNSVVTRFEPDIIINAAAYTAVDRAETEPQRASAVNADGARHLAEAAARLASCRMLHISTDYVFDGRAGRPYRVDDEPNPLNVYGNTKLAGEQAVSAILGDRALILRTSWVYAPYGKNFLLTMLGKMRETGSVRVIADQTGTPTAAESVATALWRGVELPHVHGILHWTDGGATTWHGFASAIAEEGLACGLLLRPVEVVRINTGDYPALASRPSNSVLEVDSTASVLGMEQVPWRASLVRTMMAPWLR